MNLIMCFIQEEEKKQYGKRQNHFMSVIENVFSQIPK